ncbi:cysteine desulfurase [Cloacibacterium rupense]|uniref:cysteine desulfurase n=1 Tax=Cloacibacterium rupense TaxID=517423 RepID=A0ABQ2NNG3_9FLAO|nr:cysteine desulfurase family protein [Cloacibacterium rupense]GGP06363.1 cysteine desulfurase [Cloacibacterium rupense]
MKRIYLDNAATTPILDEVIDAMMTVMKTNFGNPSSTHSLGQEAKMILEENRRLIAQELHVSPAEIIFTSCGTEANNLIIKSAVENLEIKRIITTEIEHKCVYETVLDVQQKSSIEVVYLQVNKKGDVDLDELENVLKTSDKTTLVSLMHANNEIGNLLDLEKTAKICKDNQAYFHSDTVQTMAHLKLDFSQIPIDFASCSAHKFHGPKGAGFAYIRKSTHLKAQIHGGTQERSLRAGTENVVGIAGLGKAFEFSVEKMAEFSEYIQGIKDYAIEQLTKNIPGILFNGRSAEKEKSLYTLLSISLPSMNPLIGLQLDMKGIAVSQGSACSSGAAKPSSVLSKILPEQVQQTTTPLRISFSHQTSKNDIDQLVNALREILGL